MKKIVLLTLCFMIVSCASIMNDRGQPVQINSNVPNTPIVIKDEKGVIVYSGNAPTSVYLAGGNSGYFSSKKYTVEAQKEGYTPTITTIDSYVSNWYIGNILLGGLIGLLIVDPMTGLMYKPTEQVSLYLTPTDSPSHRHKQEKVKNQFIEDYSDYE